MSSDSDLSPVRRPRRVSSENGDSQTIVRDSRGERVTVEEYARRREAEAKRLEELRRVEWGSGLVQKRLKGEERQRLKEEKSKPFARYRDDERLNLSLRKRSRWEDPLMRMENSISSSKRSVEDQRKPLYSGKPWPNRFHILPGYRWDGIDRSNGWETERFKLMNARKVRDQQAFEWSVEDM